METPDSYRNARQGSLFRILSLVCRAAVFER